MKIKGAREERVEGMSRIAKIPIQIPDKIKVTIAAGKVQMEGPKGKLEMAVPANIQIVQQDKTLSVNRTGNDKQSRANHGTMRAILANMIEGLMNGHTRELEIQGIGFRAALQGKKIVFNLGLSHPVEFEIPAGVNIKVPTQTSILIEGADNILVGQTAASIRAIKEVEPYKGKGIRYVGENVRRKQGKSVAK
jgi:large subunit ribosomal protein L6